MLSKVSLMQVDIVYLDCFTVYGLKDLLSSRSPMGINSLMTQQMLRNTSRLIVERLKDDGALCLLFGAWRDRIGERHIFTFFILTPHLYLYRIGRQYGTKQDVIMALSKPEIALTSKYPTRQQRLTLFQSTWASTYANLLMETMKRIRARMADYGDDGI